MIETAEQMWHVPHAPRNIPRIEMSFLNSHKFQDRQEAAAKARKAMVDKFQARPKYDPTDPAVLAREAERKRVLESRIEREKERAIRKAEQEAAEAARKLAQEAARLEALRLEELARQEALAAERADVEKLEFEKKLERDARYAARKERKKKKLSVAERWGR
jgi:hypothetical protein